MYAFARPPSPLPLHCVRTTWTAPYVIVSLFILDKEPIIIIDRELADGSLEIVRNCLTVIHADPMNSKSTYGKSIQKLAKSFLDDVDQTALQSKSQELIQFVYKTIKETNFLKAASREKMWRSVLIKLQTKHDDDDEDTQSTNLMKEWRDVMPEGIEQRTASGFFYCLLTKIILALISRENKKKEDASSKDIDVSLSKEEQEVVYYVAGFIAYSFKKKYTKIIDKNKDNKAASTAVEFFKTLSECDVAGKSFLDFARNWTNLRDRGGLVKVNDIMFLFVRRIENIIRHTLNVSFLKKYRGEDLRSQLFEEVMKHSTVASYWDNLTRNLANSKLKEILKQQVVYKWIDIRANSFVNSYIQSIRRKLNKLSKEEKEQTTVVVAKQGEVGLRKSLK